MSFGPSDATIRYNANRIPIFALAIRLRPSIRIRWRYAVYQPSCTARPFEGFTGKTDSDASGNQG